MVQDFIWHVWLCVTANNSGYAQENAESWCLCDVRPTRAQEDVARNQDVCLLNEVGWWEINVGQMPPKWRTINVHASGNPCRSLVTNQMFFFTNSKVPQNQNIFGRPMSVFQSCVWYIQDYFPQITASREIIILICLDKMGNVNIIYVYTEAECLKNYFSYIG